MNYSKNGKSVNIFGIGTGNFRLESESASRPLTSLKLPPLKANLTRRYDNFYLGAGRVKYVNGKLKLDIPVYSPSIWSVVDNLNRTIPLCDVEMKSKETPLNSKFNLKYAQSNAPIFNSHVEDHISFIQSFFKETVLLKDHADLVQSLVLKLGLVDLNSLQFTKIIMQYMNSDLENDSRFHDFSSLKNYFESYKWYLVEKKKELDLMEFATDMLKTDYWDSWVDEKMKLLIARVLSVIQRKKMSQWTSFKFDSSRHPPDLKSFDGNNGVQYLKCQRPANSRGVHVLSADPNVVNFFEMMDANGDRFRYHLL